MHKVSLPDEFLEELATRRGKRRVFEQITPSRTSLIVVDMQNFFVAEDGYSFVPAARHIVPNINRLAEALRGAGGLVTWIRTTLETEGRSAWHTYFDNFVPAGLTEARRAGLMPGDRLHAFWPALDIRDNDLIVDKDRFSAFIGGASHLEETLHERGVDTVLIAGTLTNVCCESTARDAMMRDFKVLMISDGNAARTDEDHLAGLRTFVQVFGDVVSTDEAIELIGESETT